VLWYLATCLMLVEVCLMVRAVHWPLTSPLFCMICVCMCVCRSDRWRQAVRQVWSHYRRHRCGGTDWTGAEHRQGSGGIIQGMYTSPVFF
jgi:hypothetical protein